MNKNYDEVSVVRSLSKKSTIAIDTNNKVISIDRKSTELGNGSWGKIDFLCNYRDYSYIFVDSVGKRVVAQSDNVNENGIGDRKLSKREAKLNMAAMSKSAMRRVKTK